MDSPWLWIVSACASGVLLGALVARPGPLTGLAAGLAVTVTIAVVLLARRSQQARRTDAEVSPAVWTLTDGEVVRTTPGLLAIGRFDAEIVTFGPMPDGRVVLDVIAPVGSPVAEPAVIVVDAHPLLMGWIPEVTVVSVVLSDDVARFVSSGPVSGSHRARLSQGPTSVQVRCY